MDARRIVPLGTLVLTLLGAGAISASPAADLPFDVDAIRHVLLDPIRIDELLPDDPPGAHRRASSRVATIRPLRIDPSRDVSRELRSDGTESLRLRISSPGAVFLSFKLDQFELSPGAQLWFHSVDRSHRVGPFTEEHNLPARRFGSPMVPGDSVVIELRRRLGSSGLPFVVESVSHGYRDVMGMGSAPLRAGREPGADDSTAVDLDCQRDINCPEGAPYQDDKRAVAEGYDGTYVCSGLMINNTRQDCRNLYLTADHCGWWRDPATMVYYWNYENSGCGTDDAPWTFSTGSRDLYHSPVADVDLLLLSGTDLAETYDIYFSGWSRATTAPTSSASISFPDDQPMQIHIEHDPVDDCLPAGCPGGYGPDYWRVSGWDVGLTQGGSSGAGLLDPAHRVVGLLSGGIGEGCSDFEWDEFGKLHVEWPGLQPFLDPDNLGTSAIGGLDRRNCDCATEVDVTPDTPAETCVGKAQEFVATPLGGVEPFSYQWTEDGDDLIDGPEVSGARGPVLTVSSSAVRSHEYNCKVTDASGQCFDIADPVSAAGSWRSCTPPPVADGVAGTAMRFSRVRGLPDAIRVEFDAATCSSARAIVLWGDLGDWSGYRGDVGTDCDLGNSGLGSFEFSGQGVWFNLVWVDAEATAGHPGDSTSGNRTWSAAGLCGVLSDEAQDPTCD